MVSSRREGGMKEHKGKEMATDCHRKNYWLTVCTGLLLLSGYSSLTCKSCTLSELQFLKVFFL